MHIRSKIASICHSLDVFFRFLDAEPEREKLILLHTGHYFPEPILISCSVQIIGASMFPSIHMF